MNLTEVVLMDKYGRIVIPKKIRRMIKANRFIIYMSEDGSLILKPVSRKKLTEFFDSIEADVPPEAFEDYNTLKEKLLSGKNEIH